MELYVGGMAQGKLSYVLGRHPELSEKDVYDATRDDISGLSGKKIIDHFHMLVRSGNKKEIIEELIRDDSLIIISDEIGSGVIPADEKEIHYREDTGRYLCLIAARSVHFERIICGIGQVLK